MKHLIIYSFNTKVKLNNDDFSFAVIKMKKYIRDINPDFNRSDGQEVSGTDCGVNGVSLSPTSMQVFSTVQGHCTTRFL